MQRGDIVLVDTTLIIEAHNTGRLPALTQGFRFETVEECVIETQRRSEGRPPELRIDEARLRGQLKDVHAVSDAERAAVAIIGGPALGPGERDLWAHALGRDDSWILCGPDRASMKFGYHAKARDRLVALEALLAVLGHTPAIPIRNHYTQAWLDDLMQKYVLGLPKLAGK
jgi:hypothetical protein